LLFVSPQILFLDALRESPALRREFGTIDVAATTAAAYGQATRRPRLALVDRLMPGQPLRAVLGHLRLRSPETRFAVLTEFPLAAHVSDAVAAGAHGVVTRRMTLKQIVEALRTVGTGGTTYPTRATKLAASLNGNPPGGVAQLTAREVDVLLCLARAMTLVECALELGLSRNTVDNHRTRLMAKLGVHRTVELPWIALREGLLSLW
jgi:DNA-binding NarL/FixJ family response regulator